jgi:hypothetical protein
MYQSDNKQVPADNVRDDLPYSSSAELRWATDSDGQTVCYVDHIVFREMLESGITRVSFTVQEHVLPRVYGAVRAGRD